MRPHKYLHPLPNPPSPAPSARKSVIRLHRKLPSEPPASTQEVSESEVPVHVPLRRPRPFRFERLPVLVWNPYSRGRLGPAKSEDPKGGEGKVDANLTNFLSTDAAGATAPTKVVSWRVPAPAHRRNFKACFLEVTSYWRGVGGFIALSLPPPPRSATRWQGKP